MGYAGCVPPCSPMLKR